MIKPSKTILVPYSAIFYFEHVSPRVSLNFFLDWIKENIPKNAIDPVIELTEESSSYLTFTYTLKPPNIKYDDELKKYLKFKRKNKNG